MKTTRFWRLHDTTNPGEFFYVDPAEIIVVQKTTTDGEKPVSPFFEIYMRSGDSWEVTDDDGLKLMHWAEANADELPECGPVPNGWK